MAILMCRIARLPTNNISNGKFSQSIVELNKPMTEQWIREFHNIDTNQTYTLKSEQSLNQKGDELLVETSKFLKNNIKLNIHLDTYPLIDHNNFVNGFGMHSVCYSFNIGSWSNNIKLPTIVSPSIRGYSICNSNDTDKWNFHVEIYTPPLPNRKLVASYSGQMAMI
ncbi:unnamed protein product [Didymodactylos carnosus]|uniref:Uncharacterized protein n=1 Tax=Didymodactylos carnosus TaxID=1234261 RepID=A0A815SDZ9_9BILA|nr:unnamed protein product [Didymodactylos carnosus]CAF4353957.1 unnamed protein product [Didymodactylos carnosus]